MSPLNRPKRWGSQHETIVDGAPADGRPLERLGPYAVMGRLGQGGMGEVLELEDAALGRRIAGKVLLHSDPTLAGRFAEEARLTGQLEHPNVVPVHVLAEGADGRPYYTMQRILGGDLQALLDASRAHAEAARPLGARLEVFLKICDAIDFAHACGVIHRDLKPNNVMLGAFGEVLVVDWGLAKRIGEADASAMASAAMAAGRQGSLDGEIKGTPAYMAPEQARGDAASVGPASDIYALGAMLYALLTYLPPVEGDRLEEVLERAAAGQITPPSRRAPTQEVPWELEAVVMRAMARAPAKRYADVASLADEVRRFLRGESLTSIRYRPGQHLARWGRRHRGPIAAVAMVLVSVSSVVGGLGWRDYRARAALANDARAVAGRWSWLPDGVAAQRALDTKDEVDPAATQAALIQYQRAVRELDAGLALAPGDAHVRGLARTAREGVLLLALRAGAPTLAEAVLDELDSPELRAEAQRHAERTLARCERILAQILERPPTDDLERRVTDALILRHDTTVRALAERLDAYAREAPRAWSEVERDRIVLLCRVLGHIGHPDALAPLARWSEAVRDDQLSIEAGWALCATRSAAALPPLLAMQSRLDLHGRVWRQIAAAMTRVPEPVWTKEPEDWAEYVARGRTLTTLGLTTKAIANFDAALRLHPRNSSALLDRAIAKSRAGDRKGAVIDLSSALERLSKGPEGAIGRVNALVTRGGIYESLGEWDLALADADAAIAINPRKTEAHHHRGNVLLWLKRPRDALDAYTRAVELQPQALSLVGQGECLIALGQRDDADLVLSRAIELDPARAESYVARGRCRALLDKLQAGLEDFDRAIELNPSYANAYVARAQCRDLLGDVETGIADLNRAIQLEPGQPDTYRARGAMRLSNDDVPGCHADYERAIELGAGPIALAERGHHYATVGLTAEAIVDLDRAIAAGVSTWWAFTSRAGLFDVSERERALAMFERALSLAVGPDRRRPLAGRALVRLALGQVEEALADLDVAIALGHRDYRAFQARADIHAKAGRHALARDNCLEMVREDPDDLDGWRMLGDAHRECGDHRAALPAYARAIELGPDHTTAYINRSLSLQALGDLESAEDDLRAALRIRPDRWSTMAYLGYVLAQRGRKTDGLALLEQARRLAPKSPLVARLLKQAQALPGDR